MPEINLCLLCIIAAGVCVTALTLDQVKDRQDGANQRLNGINGEIEALKRSIEMQSSLLYDIRDLLAETPSTALRKRIADYKEREHQREELESALSELPGLLALAKESEEDQAKQI